jgi:hypothetical protein
MTQTPEFGRVENVPLREAWEHEALRFTPWLAANLDRLGDALGIPLELVQTEAPVTTFAADIHARNPDDDSIVLIENQLDDSDHGHLGQIMTYLAGLSAKTVVWVAPRFRDAHRSAIQWLNENTADRFAFFAVEVRVVRIGNSPMAPVFEIVERPNTWERSVREQARDEQPRSEFGELRKAFWTYFLERCPSEQANGPPRATGSRWRNPTPSGLVVAQYIARDRVGVFVRGGRGVAAEDVARELEPLRVRLEQVFGAPINGGDYLFIKRLKINTADRANWDRMSDWLHEQADAYVAALERVTEGT